VEGGLEIIPSEVFAPYHDRRWNAETDHDVPILDLPVVFIKEVQKFDRPTASHESRPQAVQTRPRRRHEARDRRHSTRPTDETQRPSAVSRRWASASSSTMSLEGKRSST
jgi:hypothetical protein